MTNKILIELKNISKSFEDESVLANINLYIRDKEFITLLGPSGCGKTTTLRIIGGFLFPDSGELYFEEKIINKLPPYKRNINTVFQKYALFPHLNVYDNVAFGLKIKKYKKNEIKEKVKKILSLVNMAEYARRDIDALSGGQQQRVAIARALVNEPKVLLLDEPLGALDLKLRKEMQLELKKIQQKLGITFIYVTHDQEEALTMSDTIVVINKGKIQQIGTPEDIYNEPKNAFVADFIGESNILSGIMKRDKLVHFAQRDFECLDGGFSPDEDIDVVIRPEDIKLCSKEAGMLSGTIKSSVFMGVHYEMIISVAGIDFMVHSTKTGDVGSEAGLIITPDDIHIMRKVVNI